MPKPWLHIVGIGENGTEGLTADALEAVESAGTLIGARRHLERFSHTAARRMEWPSPFDALTAEIKRLRGGKVAVLATGDPLWYSVGARIGREIPPGEITYHPQLSAFQLAAARLGWSMADLETLTAHGRPAEQVIPWIAPGQRLLILATGSETPGQVAGILARWGFGPSKMTVLASMGGRNEARLEGEAATWGRRKAPEFNTLAVECVPGPDAVIASTVPGLDDGMFVHDGVMTKREVRSATISRLMPARGALLWDVGCGCGSVAIEWMRGARDAMAVGIERNPKRISMALQNATALGAPRLQVIEGEAPEALRSLDRPDAVFIGGGISDRVARACFRALKPFGRLVANAVTAESESVLLKAKNSLGGELIRIAVSRAEPVGGMTGWKPLMPVTQWSLVKR